MKGFMKKLTALILAVTMLVTTLTPQALAALVDNQPDQNDKILQELTGFWGDDKTAQEAVELLRQYNLIDEDGNVLSDWSGEIYIQDGETPRPTSVEELTALLEDETVSRDTVVTVDGTEITLGGFETILEIEAQVSRIRETYLQDEVELTSEQATNLYSLYEQLSQNGIQLYSANGADELEFPSGVDQTQRVSVTPAVTVQNGGTGTITLSLAHAAKSQVTLSWRIAEGSATGTIGGETSGTVTFAAGEQTKTLTVASSSEERWNGDRVFEVLFDNIQGALFSNETVAANTTVTVHKDYTYPTEYNPKTYQKLYADFLPDDFWGGDGSSCKYIQTLNGENLTVTHFKYEDYKLFDFYWKDSQNISHNLTASPYNDGSAIECIEYSVTAPSGGVKTGIRILYQPEFSSLVEDGIYDKLTFQSANSNGSTAQGSIRVEGQSFGSSSTIYSLADTKKGYFTLELDFTSSGKFQLDLYNPAVIRTDGPTVKGVTAPAGPYYPGQVVPITVELSEPVYGEGLTLTANGKNLSAVDTGAGHFGYRQTFLYTVPENGDTQLRVTGLTGMKDLIDQTATWTPTETEGQILPAESLKIPTFLSAVDDTPTANAGQVTYTPAQGDQKEKTTATVTVTLDMPSDKNLRNLIGGSYALDNGGFASSKLAGSIDGGKTLIPLVLDDGTNPTKMTATVELDAAELIDKQCYVMEFYTIDGNTHQSTGLLFGRYAAFTVNKPVPLEAEHLSIKTPEGWPAEPFFVNNPPAKSALTLKAVVNPPQGCTWTQTKWVSSDESIATIDENGVVSPLGAGTVQFYLEAVNGNLKTYAGRRSKPVTLTIQQGNQPYLSIPQEKVTIRSGDPMTLRWASNLVQKNREYGSPNTPTTFTITVTGPDGNKVGTPYTITYDPTAPDGKFTMGDGSEMPMWTKGENGTLTPNQSFTITGLTDTNPNGYTITISASANASVPGTKDFTATTKVTVISKPVTVRLTRPDNMFQVNEGTLTVPYTLENYDSTNNASFKLVVTDNATGQAVTTIEDPDNDKGGSFTIDLANAGIKDNFRTIYDVSLQAKNVAENDWSRDSFTLYIYDKDCLDILVQPVTKGTVDTVKVDGDKVTMSNEEWIASLTQKQILALNRDINLQAAISINYGNHAWGEASDRIKWASKNSKTAAVNYPQGAYYENIEALPYTSYAPVTQFLLSGKNDGTTVVEAIHDLAGGALRSQVDVTVETLKNKLYLFQLYPVGQATMTYTNGDGETKTHKTDTNGRAAVYEASGIASDVYVETEIGGEKYLGTVYNSTLASQEKDAVSLELYPLNSLNLRKAASLPVYLKKPDGTNFSGNVTVRAGVYRNGEYCADAKYNTTSGAASIDGGENNTATFTDGKATFYYDLTQFNTNNGANPVTAADNIQFVLELQAEGYYPVLFTANGTTNEDDAIRLSERIVNLETVPAGQENHPFVARQTVYFSGKESGAATDVRNQTGKTGPSGDYSDLLLSTTVFWWGQDNDQSSRTIQYTDSTGIVLTGQEQAAGSYYPFCSMPVSHSTVHLNKAQMDHLHMDDLTIRSLTLNYLDGSGTAIKKETMRWQLMNALNMPKAGESNDLAEAMNALHDIMKNDGGMSNVGSGFLTIGLKLATSAKIESDFLTLRLAPTQDPTVFRGLVYVGLGTEGEGVTGAGGYDGNILDTMEPDDESYELEYMPGLDDVKDMISSGLKGYGQSQVNQLTAAKTLLAGNMKQGGLRSVGADGGFGGEFSLSGWFETEVFYDFNAKAWKMQLVTGGMKAAGGFGYEWSSNFQVGPVPMFLELGVGISTAVEFNAAVNNVEKVNDYLTQLEIGAYLNAFGGFGFDYAVVALKLGIFGELTLDAQLRWLNAAGSSSAQFGHNVTLAGEVGVKAEVTVLFISYSTVLWSAGFDKSLGTSGNWDDIENYWKEVGAGKTSAGGIIVPNSARMLAYDAATGTAILSAEQEAVLEDRDYLSQYERSYDSSGPSLPRKSSGARRLVRQTGSQIVTTLENSYSLASPVLSDDGSWMFYLDDGKDARNATNVRVAAMKRNGSNGYDTDSRLDNDGYGDSGLKAAGSGSSPVAVWSRVTKEPAVTEAGQAITADVQADMLNSSDIMVAVRNGSEWKVTNLTGNNGVADLSPVVATNGSRILVAWRQVASTSATDLTNFNAKDYIYYSVSTDNGASWTQAAPLYNGTSGSVKGLEAAMLPSGEAAIVFTLQNGEPAENQTTGEVSYHQEIAYAIVGNSAEGGTTNAVARYVQVTDDTNLDENPQIAAVKLNDTDSAFILGWHCLSGDGSDIRLAAIDKSGSRITGFVDSLNSMIQNTGVAVSANFQFAKNAKNLDDLSILWTESDGGGDNKSPSHDNLSALRFRTENSKISVTSAQRLVEMGDYTAIDSFNAYVGENDKNLYAALQGTYYDYSQPERVQVDDTIVQVASDKTSIYTTVGAYTDTLRVDSVIPDYANIRKGTALPVQFSVTNLGTQPIKQIDVKIDSETTTFQEGTDSAFVAIAPGDTRVLTAFYTVPSTGSIPNPKYTVTGTFQSGSTNASGEETLVLNIPDLGIADSGILLDAVDGQRILQFNLYNLSDAELAGSGRTVQFQLYSDAACTNAIDSQYLTLVKSGKSADTLLTIDGDDLKAIDEGSYTLQYKFNLQQYIQDTTDFKDNDGEVRDGGVTLYAKAWVQLADGEMLEYNDSNNMADIQFESLLKQADGAPTTVTSALDNSGEGSKVAVTLQNNSMTKKTTGNVIVNLLDADGKVLEQKQSYTADATNNGLVTLDTEARQTLNMAFTKKGADVQVLYSDAVLTDNTNAKIQSLSLNGVPLSYDEASKTWRNTGTYTAGDNYLLSIVPDDPRAKVEVNGTLYSGSTIPMSLKEGDTTVTITVTAQNNQNKETYSLKLATPVLVSGVTLDKTSLNLTVGGSETLTATVLPAEAANQNVSWTSNNSSVATVESGKVTAVSAGTATITVTTADGGHSASCTVTVKNTAGGGSGGGGGSWVSYYSVNVSAADHGKVTADRSSMYASGTVTLTVTPDEGYRLKTLAVANAQGKAVELTEKDGKYTFKMPSGKVTVTAEFEPAAATPTPGPSESPSPKPSTSPSPKPSTSPSPAPTGSPSPEPWQNPFSDVSDTGWYIEAIEFVCQKGLMAGYGKGKFGPNDTVTRAQFAQIIYNSEGRPNAAGGKFTDVKDGQWYANAVNWAAAQGIVAGIGNGKFAPGNPITREQLAVMLWRYAGSPEPRKDELDFSDAGKVSAYAQKALCWANENSIVSGKGNRILDPKGKATRAEAAQMLMNYFEKVVDNAQ